jgi:hypothetical protein
MVVGGISMPLSALELNERRRLLKMPVATLVKLSGVARPTVFRILRGHLDSVRFGHVNRVASVLGLGFGSVPIEPEEFRRQEARRKARIVTRLTQGTMALES